MESKYKAKLKRRGLDVYNMYFFNNNNIIDYIVNNIDNGNIIDDKIVDTIIKASNKDKIQELIRYYPNKLKEYKIITDNVIDDIYLDFGETIEIMRLSKINNSVNVRGKICHSASMRAKKDNIDFDLISEDIKLVKICPLLNVTLEYGNTSVTNYSASIDRIDSTLGYTRDNIQIISMLANNMKSSASSDELITFSENILKIFKK